MSERKETVRNPAIPDHNLFTEYDTYLFKQGKHFKLYEKLGSHIIEVDGVKGVHFAVWAPNAKQVSVIGDFNAWDQSAHLLLRRKDGSGIWEGFIPTIGKGVLYKHHIISSNGGAAEKGDPFCFYWETPPRTACRAWDLEFDWRDSEWMRERRKHNSPSSPMSIYEVHLGAWRRVPENNDRGLTYKEAADYLCGYVREMGFTHIEFLPIMEHPFYGSWGYQITGYFAPTSRYGTPQEFMYLVDRLHQENIGVILDWVPSHFPTDLHGLVYYDGSFLFEYGDFRKRFHPDWNSYIFDYGKNEVRSFLTSNALFWLDKYHVDGLRVDAVASMLYLDYSRKDGEWAPNVYGGRENLEAISFIRDLNEVVYNNYPDVQMIAEESTAWPMVSRPTYVGGLGFGMKWNMGWMHDTLGYLSKDPIHRKFHHDQLTFSIWYAFSENFILPLSHDEVVHGKGSLLSKMPGDAWQKFANLRLLLGYMYAHPGKKLLFMGGEFGQWSEWNHDTSLDWHLLESIQHHGIQRWVSDLNRLYRDEDALHELDFEAGGFEWVDASDWQHSVISFLRKAKRSGNSFLIVSNFTPIPRTDYRIGVPRVGLWEEVLNSDAKTYGGSNLGNLGGVRSAQIPFHGKNHSVSVTLPPLGIIFLKNREA